MTLGIFLALGDSFEEMSKTGQGSKFRNFYLNYFSNSFNEIYIFSYANEVIKDLPKNVKLIPNKYNIHRYLYGVLAPFLNLNIILKCDVFRVYHLSGTVPAILSRIFFSKKYVFNYAYDYFRFAMIEGKIMQGMFFKILEIPALFFAYKIYLANKVIAKRFKSQKSVYLPNGVDTDFFKPFSSSKSKKSSRLLSVGRFEKQKNYINLIKALKGLPVKLTLVGNGSLFKEIKNNASILKVKLTIKKRVENSKMNEIYNQADIFVLPSLIEGHPKVLLEAMACGLPAVGSEVEGIKELIVDGKTGLICQTDVDSIHRVLDKLIKDQKLQKSISKNSRQLMIKKYDLTKLLAREVSVLKS